MSKQEQKFVILRGVFDNDLNCVVNWRRVYRGLSKDWKFKPMSLEKAFEYANSWLGAYGSEERIVKALEMPYDYSGYGDCIIITAVQNERYYVRNLKNIDRLEPPQHA